MAISLYSKDSVDALVAGKISDAPSDGSTYGRKDGAWVTTAAMNDNQIIANAIAANIAFVTASSNYGRWVGNQAPSIATTVSWGLTDGTTTAPYTYSSSNNFYYSGTLTGSTFRVIVSGSVSTFQVS